MLGSSYKAPNTKFSCNDFRRQVIKTYFKMSLNKQGLRKKLRGKSVCLGELLSNPTHARDSFWISF